MTPANERAGNSEHKRPPKPARQSSTLLNQYIFGMARTGEPFLGVRQIILYPQTKYIFNAAEENQSL